MSNKSTDPFAAVTVVDQVRESEETKITGLRDSDGKIDLFGKEPIQEIDSVKEVEDVDNDTDDVDDEEVIVGDVFEEKNTDEEEEEDFEEEKEEDNDEDDDSEEGQAEDGEHEDEEVDDVNLHYHIAKELKRDGFVSDDFEIDEETTLHDVYSHLKDNLQESVVEELQTQAYNQLIELGYNDQDLKFAKLIRSGVDMNMLSDISRYESLSNIKPDEAPQDALESLIQEYYKDRKWNADEISEKLEDLKLDDNMLDVAEKAKKYFKSKYATTLENHEATAAQQRAHQEALQKQRLQYVEELLDKGDLLGEKITNKASFKKALYQQTHVAEIGGKEYPVSEYQLFALNFQNDPSVALWAFNQWKNKGENNKTVKKEAKAEAETELFTGLKKIYTKSKGKTVTRGPSKSKKTKTSKSTDKPRTETGRLIRQLRGGGA
jgi:hypothetical protein